MLTCNTWAPIESMRFSVQAGAYAAVQAKVPYDASIIQANDWRRRASGLHVPGVHWRSCERLCSLAGTWAPTFALNQAR